MSNKKWFILIIIAVLCSWFARGLYDELTFYSGYFHVINGTEKNKTIELTFPSGESRKTSINSGQKSSFVVLNTGEGSITVKSDNQEIGNIGYVTSFNSPIIIVVMEDKAIFSLMSLP